MAFQLPSPLLKQKKKKKKRELGRPEGSLGDKTINKKERKTAELPNSSWNRDEAWNMVGFRPKTPIHYHSWCIPSFIWWSMVPLSLDPCPPFLLAMTMLSEAPSIGSNRFLLCSFRPSFFMWWWWRDWVPLVPILALLFSFWWSPAHFCLWNPPSPSSFGYGWNTSQSKKKKKKS